MREQETGMSPADLHTSAGAKTGLFAIFTPIVRGQDRIQARLLLRRRTLDATGEEVVGARWVCTSCHLAKTDTEPLVANTAPRRALAGDAADEEVLR